MNFLLTVLGGIGSLIAGIIGFILFMLWLIGIPVIQYKLTMKKPERAGLYMILLFFLNPFGTIITVILLSMKFSKMRNEVYQNAISNASDEAVDALMTFLNKYNCENTPNAWHQLRGVWFAINESPRVTTAKKKELKTFLMTKGLYLHRDEGQIVDNYR